MSTRLNNTAVSKQILHLQKTYPAFIQSAFAAILLWLYDYPCYYGGRFLARNLPKQCFTTALDQAIPFLPWTITIYLGCYAFWAYNYVTSIMYEQKKYRFIIAHCLGEAVCFLAFILLPTTMLRPEVTGTTIFDALTRFTYAHDSADNLLPSIHVFASWLCWIGVRGNKHVPVWYQTVSFFMAAAVCISTLTIKQHVLVDVFAGILTAEISYLIADLTVTLIQRRKNKDAAR